MINFEITKLKFNGDGLIPAVIQDVHTGRVLMLAYMNQESLTKTVQSGETHFWSWSRQEFWHKGATSGNTQTVKTVTADCDGDTLLVEVEQKGNACHRGTYSCFDRQGTTSFDRVEVFGEVVSDLARRIHQRKIEKPSESYTTYLFESGIDKILKKVGEEAGEIIIAAKNKDRKEISWEVADLVYHLLVMLEERKVPLSEVAEELARRAQKRRKSG
jgi:phosphoribosyl-ATP pyrophosphohydrolase/phosphoribosyl-AMP cyclohydrolase